MDWSNPLIYLAAAGVIFSVGTWVGSMNSFKKTAKGAIGRIDKAIEKINERIGSIKVNVAVLASGKTVDASQSPIRLNEFGESISQEILGKQWAKVEATKYVEQFRGQQPYDVQKFAFGHVYQFQPPDEMGAKMKNCAYENGISIDLVLRVLAIDLRDAMLDVLGMEPPENGPAP